MKTLKNTFTPKTILLALVLVIAVLFSVRGKTKSVEEIEVSFIDLYQNRLIAENYVYKLNTRFSQKKTELINLGLNHSMSNAKLHNDSVVNLLAAFSKTKLTKDEELVFKSLKQHIGYAQSLELIATQQVDKKMDLITTYDKVLGDLNSLSIIQIKEAGNLFSNVKKSASAFSISSELFWAVGLVILLFVVSALKNNNLTLPPKQPYLLN